jgi:hypothetical protein
VCFQCVQFVFCAFVCVCGKISFLWWTFLLDFIQLRFTRHAALFLFYPCVYISPPGELSIAIASIGSDSSTDLIPKGEGAIQHLVVGNNRLVECLSCCCGVCVRMRVCALCCFCLFG